MITRGGTPTLTPVLINPSRGSVFLHTEKYENNSIEFTAGQTGILAIVLNHYFFTDSFQYIEFLF